MRQETRVPDFICFPFGCRIHFANVFSAPFGILAPIDPYWLGVKVLCQNALYHIFAGDTFIFTFFIFQCGVFQCLSLSWRGIVFDFAQELLANS